MDRLQINVRLPPEIMELLDKRRMELHGTMGKIPSRSDVVRLALDAYLSGPEGDAVARKRNPGANRRSE